MANVYWENYVWKSRLVDIQTLPEKLVQLGRDARKAQEATRENHVNSAHKAANAKRMYVDGLRAKFAVNTVRKAVQGVFRELRLLHSSLQRLVFLLIVLVRDFLGAVMEHSQGFCQDISVQIMKKLPREIRDMIYGYLCDSVSRVSMAPVRGIHHGVQNRDDFDTKIDWNQSFYGDRNVLINTLQWRSAESVAAVIENGCQYIDRVDTLLPFFCSAHYVSRDLLFELAEMLYSRVTFHIWDPSDIKELLRQDIFRVGCSPKDHISKLSLVIFTDSYDEYDTSRSSIEEQLSSLKLLLDIKHKQDFRLDLHLCITRMSHRPTVPRFQHVLLPYLYGFLAEGFTVRLPLRKYWYNYKRRAVASVLNQLQAKSSSDPEDWIVDEEELELWEKSNYIKYAFDGKLREVFHDGEDSDGFYNSDGSVSSSEDSIDSDGERIGEW